MLVYGWPQKGCCAEVKVLRIVPSTFALLRK
jgi:hypothetical protein